MKYFIEDIKRAFLSKTTVAALIFGIILSLYPILNEFKMWGNSADYFYYFRTGYGYTPIGVFALLVPCLAAMPYAHSLVMDYNEGIEKFLLYRISKKKYIRTRIISNIIVSGSILFIIQLINFIVALNIGNHNNTDIIARNQGFIGINNGNITMAIGVILINSFIFGFTYSTIALGISIFFKNKYISIISPLIIYIGGSHISRMFNMPAISTLNMYNILDISNNFIVITIYYLIFNLIGIFLCYYSLCVKEAI